MAESEYNNIEQAQDWSLDCNVVLEDENQNIQEIQIDDISLSGSMSKDIISVDVVKDFVNVMNLDVNASINGVSSSVAVSQVVPYERITKITNQSPEAINENAYAASAYAVSRHDRIIDENKKEITREFNAQKESVERRFQSAEETISMLEGTFDNFSKGITPITVQTMSMLVGDESLQFKFVEDIDSFSEVSCPVYYDSATGRMRAKECSLIHMTLGISSITSGSMDIDNYKRWSIYSWSSSLIQDPDAMFVYAKVPRNSQIASYDQYVLSKTHIDMESDIEYYHFLVGILNSEINNERSFVTLYGYTEILPGRITTDVIQSSNGRLVIDLANASIQAKEGASISGKVTFGNGSSGLENLSEWSVKQKQIDDAVADIKTLQNQLDGVVESYFEKYAPSRDNKPASDWIANGTEADHEGDTFTNTELSGDNAGKSWRWLKQENGIYDWQPIADSDAAKALAKAAQAQDTADGKRTTFVEKPNRAYQKGDIWIVGPDYTPSGFKQGDILNASQDSENYIELHWEKNVRYTDDSRAEEAISLSNQAQSAAQIANGNAQSAKQVAEASDLISQAAQQLAQAAQSNAQEAISSSNTAKDIADDAKIIAGEAQELADDAKTLADSADKKAQQATADASSAKEEAQEAKGRLDNWADDNVISPVEKQGIKDERAFVIADKSDIDKQVANYSISESSAYSDFILKHKAYKDDLDTIVDSSDEIVSIPTGMSTHQSEYYNARTTILEEIAKAAKKVADDAQGAADNAQAAADTARNIADTANTAATQAQELASTAQELASSASTIATNASTRLSNWASDRYISPVEKQGIREELQFVTSDKATIVSELTQYDLIGSNEYQDYMNAVDTYVADLNRILSNTSESVPVQYLLTYQKEFYDARTMIVSLIAATSKAYVDGVSKRVSDAEYLSNAMKNGKVIVDNGLVMSSMVAVADTEQSTQANVEAFLNGSYFAKDTVHGKLILAGGIPKTSESGSTELEDRAPEALTRIYEDGEIVTKNLTVEDGDISGTFIKAKGLFINATHYEDAPGYGSQIIGCQETGNSNSYSANYLMIECPMQESFTHDYGDGGGIYIANRDASALMSLGMGGNGSTSYHTVYDKNYNVKKRFCYTTHYGLYLKANGSAPLATITGNRSGKQSIKIDSGYVSGLRPQTFTVTENVVLTKYDYTVFMNISARVSLPKEPEDGQKYEIFNPSGVGYINGNGKTIWFRGVDYNGDFDPRNKGHLFLIYWNKNNDKWWMAAMD